MSSNRDQGDSFGPLRMDAMNPLAMLAPVVIVALALLVLSRRRDSGARKARAAANGATRLESDTTRKMMLTFVINALENDWMRRAVVMGLKVARSRM